MLFPCSVDQMDKKTMELLQQKVRKLMKDFQNNSVSIINHYKKYGKLTIQAFQPRKSKPIMDEIDSLLAIYYGLSDEELDFIKNFDFKYRMGK